MRFIRHIGRPRAFVFLLVLLAGCEGSLNLVPPPAFDLDQGVGGYTGQVDPFTVPVQLRIREVAFEGTTRYQVTTLGEQPSQLTLLVSGSVHALGDRRTHTVSVKEARTENRNLKGNEPLAVFRAISDAVGAPEVEEWTLSNFAIAHGLTEGALASLGIGLGQTFRLDPVSVGGEIYAGGLSDTAIAALQERNRHIEVETDTLRATARGLTFYQGRQHLLVELSGVLDVLSDGDRLVLTLKGFELIDLETGFSPRGVGRLTASGQRDGKPFAQEIVVQADLVVR